MVLARVGRFGPLIAAGIVLAGVSAAQATTLGGTLTVDNAFFAYISTSDSTRGTLVASGTNWPTPGSFSGFTLTAGQNYFLHIEGINQGIQGSFIGQFTLSDTGFQFANGSQTLLTDTTDWRGGYINGNSAATEQTWVMPTGTTFSEGLDGVSPWGTISASFTGADFIWPTDPSSDPGGPAAGQGGVCGFCTVAFSTTIFSQSAPTGVPEPVTVSLFGAGLAGAIALRRKAKKRA